MRLLLDTHILLWATVDPELLNIREDRRMRAPDAQICVSAVSIWEIRIKWNSFRRSGARKLDASPHEVLAFVEDMSWQLVALTPGHAAAALAQPLAHKDPFDELLLVQAQEEALRLLTRDRLLAGHPLVVN